MRAYRAANGGKVPDNATQLYPKYLSDTNLLICPVHRATAPGTPTVPWPELANPGLESSYPWEFQPKPISWKELSPDLTAGMTLREFKERQRQRYGDIVPVMSCFLHSRRLNLAVSGEAYPSGSGGATAPRSSAVSLTHPHLASRSAARSSET